MMLPWKPRSRNKFTLIPLFVDPNLDLETPTPVNNIPAEYYWQNAEGYAFDVRSLAVLLSINFRNLNPLTITPEGDYRPLWCSQEDLASLILHNRMDDKIKTLVKQRILRVRELPKSLIRRLAKLANELYSFDMQGFYRWVANDTVLPIENKPQVLADIVALQKSKREHVIRSIQHSIMAQANEHAVEPYGVPMGSELYTLMETYKAVQVTQFLDSMEDMRRAENNLMFRVQGSLDAYKEKTMMDLLMRYAKDKDDMIWHMSFHGLRRRVTMRTHVRREISMAHIHLHVRAFAKSNGEYIVQWNHVTCILPNAKAAAVFLNETVPAFLRQQQCFVMTVNFATIAGGLTKHRDRKQGHSNFRNRIEKDNLFLWLLANDWTTELPFVQQLRHHVGCLDFSEHKGLTRMRLLERMSWLKRIKAEVRPASFSPYMSYSHVLDYFIFNAELFLSHAAIAKLTISGGYDSVGAGPLLQKLKGSLDRVTCIQDVAAELCELLSIPYDPEDKELAKLQCDHTNIPPLIKTAEL